MAKRVPVSTPVKPRRAPALSRKEMETKELPQLKESSNFCDRHLASPPDLDKLAKVKAIVTASALFSATTATSYDLLADMMNKISATIHRKHASDKELIVFKRLENHKPLNHPNDYFSSRPDIVVLKKRIADLLAARGIIPSWHHIHSAFEEKTESDHKDGPTQCATYLGLLNQARPDLITVFGVAISPLGYVIQCSNPSGMDASQLFPWNELRPLISYVYTLYCPPNPHLVYDTTISLSASVGIDDPPKWDVTTSDGTIYPGCQVRMVGDPWHRMSWVVVTQDDPPNIVKDSYRSHDATYNEGDLYDTLHEAGFVLGFADIVIHHEVMSHGKIITVEADGCVRTKTRIVLATSGDLLYKCPTVVTFFEVMYDVLEAHRFAVDKRHLLHRDISIGNILINPKHAREIKPYDGDDRPKFISEVLSGKDFPEALALIIDLDNATLYYGDKVDGASDDKEEGSTSTPEDADPQKVDASLGRRDGDHEDKPSASNYQAHERTGTPKYIARGVALRRILFENNGPQRMPKLAGEALSAYEAAYKSSGDPLRTLNDVPGTTHGAFYDYDKYQEYCENEALASENFEHHPRHDAESVFWCLLASLLKAAPKNAKEDVNNGRFNKVWKSLATHEIDDDGIVESRLQIFASVPWEKVLHEGLAFVAPAVKELIAQVRPEYALLSPQPPMCHLHEALQRILFKYAHKFRSERRDVALNIKVRGARTMNRTITTDQVPETYHSANGQQPHRSATQTKERAPAAVVPNAHQTNVPTESQSLPKAASLPTTLRTTRSMKKRAAQDMEAPETSNGKRRCN